MYSKFLSALESTLTIGFSLLCRSCLLVVGSLAIAMISTFSVGADETTHPTQVTTAIRGGESIFETYIDVLIPFADNANKTFFFNPRISTTDGGSNEINFGFGGRKLLGSDKAIVGANVYYDTRHTSLDNRFHQYGAGFEILSDPIDFRFNVYETDSNRKLVSSNTTTNVSTDVSASQTRTTDVDVDVSSSVSVSSAGTTTSTTTTTTATTTLATTTTTLTSTTMRTTKLFEVSQDGWDTEIGFKLPNKTGPETRFFIGYYSFDTSTGGDIKGGKIRLESRLGSYIAFDLEVLEDDKLFDTDYFLGIRVQIPFGKGKGIKNFMQSFKQPHRTLDQRLTTDIVMRDIHIHTDSDTTTTTDTTTDSSQKTTTERIVDVDVSTMSTFVPAPVVVDPPRNEDN